MNESILYLLSGVALGAAGGLAPGPLTALVLSETLRHGRSGGVRVALAPLVTDAPIVAAALGLLSALARMKGILAGLSFAGAAYVVWLGIQSLRAGNPDACAAPAPARSLRKGVVANLLNPHPYLFWFTVGAPTTVRAWGAGWGAAVGFLIGFYGLLVGTKIAMAVLADRSRRWLSGRGYRAANAVLGLILLVFAALLARDGFRFLGALR